MLNSVLMYPLVRISLLKRFTFVSAVVLVFIFIFLSTSCTLNAREKLFTNQIPSENGSFEVYFCPKDPCETILNTELNKSTTSVHCAWYDLDLTSTQIVLNELVQKRDIEVHIVLDNGNPLKDPLFSFKTDHTDALMHNKFCIIDSSIVVMGSMNPTENDAHQNNNNLLVLHSQYLSENYETEFEELWTGSFGRGSKTPYPEIVLNNTTITTLFCPEDNCESAILREIKHANTSITFMTFAFTSPSIGKALIHKAEQGCIVEGIFERFTNKYSQYYVLSKANASLPLTVSWDTSNDLLHHKVFIIDNKTVITGSYNPTKAANEKNDENILIIHDPKTAELYLQEFNSLKT